jgi:transcriptional regulator with XRE-family HTH domain
MANTMTTSPTVVPVWTLADRLRKARQFSGLTPEELAERIGVTDRTVRNYETGKPPRAAAVKLWAFATGVPLDWLLGTTDSDEGGSTPSTWTPLMARQAA